MAASLKGLDPDLRKYLRINKLPDMYEALLTGLAVMCPEDPLQFILDRLRLIKEIGLENLQWDMFVEESEKPKMRFFSESNLDFLFNFDEYLLPSPEMAMLGWMQYHLTEQKKEGENTEEIESGSFDIIPTSMFKCTPQHFT
ncbi:dynein regulatory complex subunit 6-like, partial [Haliotis rubra]|uniref:dynein regulatory complex subunit 6-like n=1 Tax=Haliotis rubra TaxID=36100 RepID=UPI001EE625DA